MEPATASFLVRVTNNVATRHMFTTSQLIKAAYIQLTRDSGIGTRQRSFLQVTITIRRKLGAAGHVSSPRWRPPREPGVDSALTFENIVNYQ